MNSEKLEVGAIGDEVTQLHKALINQGYEISPEEVKRKFFGPSTREAVGEFQKARGIDPSCGVCEKTAALLFRQPEQTEFSLGSRPSTLASGNDQFSQLEQTEFSVGSSLSTSVSGNDQQISIGTNIGTSSTGKPGNNNIPTPRAQVTTSKVEGRIFLDNGLVAQGVTIRAYHLGFGGQEILLGQSKTDGKGGYSLTYQNAYKSVNLEIRVVDDVKEQEISLSKTKFNVESKEFLNLVAPAYIQPMATEYNRLSSALLQCIKSLDELVQAEENSEQKDFTILHQETGWDARLIVLITEAVKLAAEIRIPPEAIYAMFRVGLPRNKEQLALLDEEIVKKAIAKAQESGLIEFTNQQIAEVKKAFQSFALKTRSQAIAPGTLSSVKDILEKSALNEAEQKTFTELAFRYEGQKLWEKAKEKNISEGKINNLQLQGKLAYLTLNNAALTAELQDKLQSVKNLEQLAEDEYYKPESWRNRLNSLAGNEEKVLQTLIPPAYEGKNIGDRLDAYANDLARKVRLSFPTQVVRCMIDKDELALSSDLGELKTNVSKFLKNAVALGFELGKTPLAAFIRDHQNLFQGITPSQISQTTGEIKRLQRLYQITPSNEALQVLMKQGFDSAQDITAFSYKTFLEFYSKEFSSLEEAKLIYKKAQQVTSISANLVLTINQFNSAPPIFATSPSIFNSSPPATTSEEVSLKSSAKSSPTDSLETAKDRLIKIYPTLENLFGSLDFCECEHCRSVLSPAAYFVDLLDFLDYKVDLTPDDNPLLLRNSDIKEWKKKLATWKNKHDAAYPFKTITEQNNAINEWKTRHPEDVPLADEDVLKNLGALKTPYEVLIKRRPDLPHIALTCENTNTALPYIDIVNEILEYYVANDRLTENSVNNTGSASTAELLAEPQNVIEEAYITLKEAKYPLNLPFDYWLETIRRFFEHFETPLSHVLNLLRSTDRIFPTTNSKDAYYRNAIWAESLSISPAEYDIFTNFEAEKWYELYGFCNVRTAITQNIDDYGQRTDLNSAKVLARKLGVSYKELVELVKTEFVNPQLEQLVILSRLDIDLEDVLKYKNETFTNEETETFATRVNSLTEEVLSWLNDNNFDQILLLIDIDGKCNFDQTNLRYANGNPVNNIVFIKLNLFVRLWRKLGWPIAEVDRALQVFIPQAMFPLSQDNIGAALKTALVYIAHLQEIGDRLEIDKNSRINLLTLWSNLSTTGSNPLYAELFLKPSILKNDPVFAHPLGNYLADPQVKIIEAEDPEEENINDRLLTLQGALNLTYEEIDLILAANDQNLQTASLILENVSLLYRYKLLAKALKISVSELITVIRLSELNPFTPLKNEELTVIKDDYPFTRTIKFIETVAIIQQSNFSIEDLDYLFRHSFDPVGQYRPDSQAAIGLFKTISTEIRRIKAEHPIPSNPKTLTDEMLQEKMALIFPTEIVETFMGMWTGSISYEVFSQESVDEKEERLIPNLIKDPAISTTYDDRLEKQRLVYRGVLSDAKKNKIIAENQFIGENRLLLLSELLDAVQASQTSQKKFFRTHFQKSTSDQISLGFLAEADFDIFFSPINEAEERDRRDKLVKAFFPFVQQKLIRQFVIETLAANLNTEDPLIELLLKNINLPTEPSDSSKPLLDSFTSLGETGISASFFPSENRLGIPINKIVSSSDTSQRDTESLSASMSGYFEVPENGAYQFYILLENPNAESELKLTHLKNPLIQGRASVANTELSELTELKAGVTYQFVWNIDNLGDGNARLLIRGETLPKDNLSQLIIYPQTKVDCLQSAYTLLTKTLRLIQGFELSEREVRYFLGLKDDAEVLIFNQLPVETVETIASSSLFNLFIKLASYSNWREYLGEDIITIFESNNRVYAEAANRTQAKRNHMDLIYQILAELTRKEKTSIEAIAGYLGFAFRVTEVNGQWQVQNPDFFQASDLGKLLEILQILQKIGISFDALLRSREIVNSSKTEEEYFNIARELRNTVKAKYEQQTWLKIAQPIFDKLRQCQRDALVAYILFCNGFERQEQLFEYFLIDPGMEPVVQTSRIQLAISSIQLFIQRCLLNLEPFVSPSVINSSHWQWMKRYRVWEANRKIFLYPENFLEPEWRDNQTHLFQELMGTLLQEDISNDSAENAFFIYLQQLEKLARLQIVTMYLDEKPNSDDNVLHVIGRTYNFPHKYFYRRYVHNMWTPWEPVTAEIEGDHIVAVVWRDRLHLFWATFLEKAEANSDSSNGVESLANASFNAIVQASNQAVQKTVEVQLNWSEYYQGKWTTRESGGFENVIEVNVGNNFDKEEVFIYIDKKYEEDIDKKYEEGKEKYLQIGFLNLPPIDLGLPPINQDLIEENPSLINALLSSYEPSLNISSTCNPELTIQRISKGFKVVSKHSSPERSDYIPQPEKIPYNTNNLKSTLYKGINSLQVNFVKCSRNNNGNKTPEASKISPILQSTGEYSLLMPSNQLRLPTPEIAMLESPFFYQDNQNTFFVEPTFTEKTFHNFEGWIKVPESRWRSDDSWLGEIDIYPIDPEILETLKIAEISPVAKFPLNPQHDWLINPSTVVQSSQTIINQTGGLNFNAVTQSVNPNVLGEVEGLIDELSANHDFSVPFGVIDETGYNPNLVVNR